MSDAIGPMVVVADPEQSIAYPASSQTSEDTQRIVDQEVRRLLEEAQERVHVLLTNHRDALDSLAAALVEHETLDEDELMKAVAFQAR